MEALAVAMGYKNASGVQRYVTAGEFKKPLLPLEIARKAVSALEGKGSPPITAAEILALAGIDDPDNKKGDVPSSNEPVNVPRMEYAKNREGLPRRGDQDVPIMGLAAGGARGDFVMTSEVIGYATRRPALENVRNVYGILVWGESMVPRWYPGEPAYVNPDKPPRAGDFVVVQLRGKNGEIEGLIKQLVRMDSERVVLRQFNPEKELKFPRSEVLHVHRVYWPNELDGI